MSTHPLVRAIERLQRGEVLGCSYEPDEIGVPVTRGMHRVERALVSFLSTHRTPPAQAAGGGGSRGAVGARSGPTSRPMSRAARVLQS